MDREEITKACENIFTHINVTTIAFEYIRKNGFLPRLLQDAAVICFTQQIEDDDSKLVREALLKLEKDGCI